MPELLAKMQCEACNERSLRVTADEGTEFSTQIPEWREIDVDGERRGSARSRSRISRAHSLSRIA